MQKLEFQTVLVSRLAASTWRIETKKRTLTLNIGSYLPLCGEIQNITDLGEAAGRIIDSCINKLYAYETECSHKAVIYTIVREINLIARADKCWKLIIR